MLGHVVPSDVRSKISATLLVKNYVSKEARMRGAAKRVGFVFSEESKALMSKNRSGIPVSEEKKIQIRLARLGTHHSEETKARMRESQRKRRAVEAICVQEAAPLS